MPREYLARARKEKLPHFGFYYLFETDGPYIKKIYLTV